MGKFKFKINKKLKETSTTGGGPGAASFSPGTGAQYATPKAFSKNKDGTKPTFYYKLGYKKVPNKIKGSGLETKKLFEGNLEDKVQIRNYPGDDNDKPHFKVIMDGEEIGYLMDKITFEYGGKPNPNRPWVFRDTSPNNILGNFSSKDYNSIVKELKYKLSKILSKELNEESSSVDKFHNDRINDFDRIEEELNNIYKILSNAKNETVDYYNDNPSSYEVVYPTDLVFEYIQDIKDLLNQE